LFSERTVNLVSESEVQKSPKMESRLTLEKPVNKLQSQTHLIFEQNFTSSNEIKDDLANRMTKLEDCIKDLKSLKMMQKKIIRR